MSGRVPLPREPVEAVVDGFTHGGEGVARLEGKAVFVPGTLPGERVVLRVTEDRKKWARAELVEVLEPSPDRVEPPCPYVPECGGCDLQHADPAAQRRLKTRVVIEQLTRLGGVHDPPVVTCREVGPATGYRNRAQLHADPDGRLGFHRSKTNIVVPIDRCLVLNDAAQAVRDAVGDDSGAEELVVRGQEHTERAAATLTPGPGPLHLPEGAFDLLLEQPNGKTVTMRGTGELTEQVAGLTYAFPADAFFQNNTGGAEALVAGVLAALGDVDGALCWDLYAGVGLLSLPLARAGAEVIAVEGHRAAAPAAERNAEANGLTLRVLAEPVAAVMKRAMAGDPALEAPEVVVLDPPRSGAGAEVVTALLALAPPTIVYVACDVAALARDTRELTRGGYTLRRAVPFDLFPMTHHVEVVATFTR
jgi:tRNA/tmRNA/rRNA uracil-C5-methylase (TrmA/RlmC/RlmD family)